MDGLVFSEDVCRLCLWKSNKLMHIFGEEGEHQELLQKIQNCLPIYVTKEDIVSKLICHQCIYKLEMFCEFRNACVRSDNILTRYTSSLGTGSQPLPFLSDQEIQCQLVDDIQHADFIVFKDREQSITSNSMVENEAMLSKKLSNSNGNQFGIVPKNHDTYNISQVSQLHSLNLGPKNLDNQLKHVPEKLSKPRSNLNMGLLNKATSQNHKCLRCKKEFPSESLLNHHSTESMCLPHVKETVTDLQSQACNHTFQSQPELETHELQNCLTAAITNDHRYASRKNKGDKAKQKVTASKELVVVLEPFYDCSVCNNRYKTTGALLRHKRQKKHISDHSEKVLDRPINKVINNSSKQLRSTNEGHKSSKRLKRKIRQTYPETSWITETRHKPSSSSS